MALRTLLSPTSNLHLTRHHLPNPTTSVPNNNPHGVRHVLCNVAAQEQPLSTGDVPINDPSELSSFIKAELEGCFNTGSITTHRYNGDFVFQDPLVKLDGTGQHQLQLTLFRAAFDIQFRVFSCTRTEASTFTAPWSMTCTLRLAPWRPPLVLTGRSIVSVDPLTGRLASQRDVWDAVADVPAPSVEAYLYVLQQLTTLYSTPDLQTPAYTVLRKMREYEIRRYEDYTVASVPMASGGDRAAVTGGTGFNDLAAFTIGGQNATDTKLEMTTPVFTTAPSDAGAPPTMQFVVEGSKAGNMPAPRNPNITPSTVRSRVVAARTFGGWPQEWEVKEEERLLRGALLLDGLQPSAGYTLARYNDPFTPPWLRRNEVLIELYW